MIGFGGAAALDIESMARYWSQDAENYGNLLRLLFGNPALLKTLPVVEGSSLT